MTIIPVATFPSSEQSLGPDTMALPELESKAHVIRDTMSTPRQDETYNSDGHIYLVSLNYSFQTLSRSFRYHGSMHHQGSENESRGNSCEASDGGGPETRYKEDR